MDDYKTPLHTNMNDIKENDQLLNKNPDINQFTKMGYIIDDTTAKEKDTEDEPNHNYIQEGPILDGFPWKFYLILIAIFVQIVLTHIMKPACTFLEIIFLTRIVNINKKGELNKFEENLNIGVKAIGWVIIFGLPLVHLFLTGIMIISIQKGTVRKVYVTILCLFEIIFQFPLTFMYSNSLHSIYLFEQRGIEQLLCPWLIFFPCDFVLSGFEIARQLIDSIFFCVFGLQVYGDIKVNKYQSFNFTFLMLMIVLCIFRIVGAVAMIVIRIVIGNSEERGKHQKGITEIYEKELENKVDENQKKEENINNNGEETKFKEEEIKIDKTEETTKEKKKK